MGNEKLINISKSRKIVTVILLLCFCFWGIIAGGITIAEIQNYTNPWIFGFSTAIIGIIVGYLIARRTKDYLAVTRKLRSEYGRVIFILSVAFMGTFMLLGNKFNRTFALEEKCDDYTILDKFHEKGGRDKLPIIVLLVDIEGKQEIIHCNLPYYAQLQIGGKINICQCSGFLGFDYLNLTNQ